MTRKRTRILAFIMALILIVSCFSCLGYLGSEAVHNGADNHLSHEHKVISYEDSPLNGNLPGDEEIALSREELQKLLHQDMENTIEKSTYLFLYHPNFSMRRKMVR